MKIDNSIAAKIVATIYFIGLNYFNVIAQDALNGKWALYEKNHISGVEIINALPRIIDISANDRRVSINRVYFDKDNRTYQLSENLSTNGSETSSISQNGHHFLSKLLTYNPNTVTVEISTIKDVDNIQASYVRRDSLIISDNELKLIHANEGKMTSKDIGTYVRITSEEQTHFRDITKWDSIVALAGKENKKILVDCYASWCVPCKLMDVEVYGSPIVGERLNNNYIPVKIQFDSTANNIVFPLAKILEKKWNVNAYPTILILNSKGEPIHKSLGVMNIVQFMSMLTDLESQGTGFYELLTKFRKGTILPSNAEKLARMAKSLDEKRISDSVALNHIRNIEQKDIFSLKDLRFLSDFNSLLSVNSNIVRRVKFSSATLDTTLEGSATIMHLIDAIFNREIIGPTISECRKSGINPNWTIIYSKIEKLAGLFAAQRLLFATKAEWYRNKKAWPSYTKYLIKSISLAKPSSLNDASFYFLTLNNNAWEIFLHSTDNNELDTAIGWTDSVIAFAPTHYNAMDTKANLLYKRGKVKEAIQLEMAVINAAKKNGDFNPQYKELIEKMKRGLPTWK